MYVHFLLCNPKSGWKKAGSAVLQWAEKVNFGHFAIQLTTHQGDMVYESVLPKSRKVPLDEWLTHYKIVKQYTFEVPVDLQYKVYEWLESQLGKWYSIPQLVLIALCMVKPLNDLLNLAILNHAKALICTEYGSRFIERFMKLTINESHDKIGLHDMYDYSEQLYFKGEQRIWRQE